jgi:hypothetical protein
MTEEKQEMFDMLVEGLNNGMVSFSFRTSEDAPDDSFEPYEVVCGVGFELFYIPYSDIPNDATEEDIDNYTATHSSEEIATRLIEEVESVGSEDYTKEVYDNLRYWLYNEELNESEEENEA